MRTVTAQDLACLDEVVVSIFRLIGNHRKLKVMLGAHSFVKGYFNDTDRPGLQFKFPRSNQINCCQIVLNRQTDEYCLTFMDIKDWQVIERGEYQDLPLTNVRSVFEEVTGLYLSL
jgi:hypothetical protein